MSTDQLTDLERQLVEALKLIIKAPGAVKSIGGGRLRYDLQLTLSDFDAICGAIAKAEGRV